MRKIMVSNEVKDNLKLKKHINPLLGKEFWHIIDKLKVLPQRDCENISPLSVSIKGKVAVVISLSDVDYLVCRVSESCVEAISIRSAA